MRGRTERGAREREGKARARGLAGGDYRVVIHHRISPRFSRTVAERRTDRASHGRRGPRKQSRRPARPDQGPTRNCVEAMEGMFVPVGRNTFLNLTCITAAGLADCRTIEAASEASRYSHGDMQIGKLTG